LASVDDKYMSEEQQYLYRTMMIFQGQLGGSSDKFESGYQDNNTR
jgi:hypothetical protein